MSSLPDEYKMETGTSDVVESPDESRALAQSVDNNLLDDTNRNEEYYVITEEDHDEVDLIQNAADPEISDTNLVDLTENWMDVCRTCANTSDHLIPIFEGEGMDHELSSKIHRHLPIQVSEQDSLPVHLCYHCAATLLAWHELAEGCLDAEQRLLQMQNDSQKKQTTSIMDETLNETSIGLKTEESHVQNRNQMLHTSTVENVDCNEESSSNNIERYIGYIHSSKSASFAYFRKAYQVLLRSYENQGHRCTLSNRQSTKSVQWLDITTLNSEDGDCNASPADASNVVSNQSTQNCVLKENINIVCNVKGNVLGEIEKKIIDDEHLVVKQRCVDDTETSLASKIEDTNDDDTNSIGPKSPALLAKAMYDCTSCGKKFHQQHSLRSHMHTHTDTKRFTCHICGKQFGQPGSLYYHLKHVHGGVKQHACDICGRSFAMKAAMEDHRRIHTGERPYCCASCGKTFKTKASLYIHSKTHTDELPHKCSFCPKAFRWKQQMLGHLTIHTGQKNHICEICGKRFGVKNDLTRHRRIHSEEKPFACQQCGISFGQKRYLKNHERTRHR